MFHLEQQVKCALPECTFANRHTCFCHLSSSFDLRTLPVDFVECLMRFQPTENEVKVLRQFEKERKPLDSLTDEDRFMMQFSKIERLMQKMTIMAFIGNFTESVQMLTPVRETSQRSNIIFPIRPAGLTSAQLSPSSLPRSNCTLSLRHLCPSSHHRS